MLKILHLCRQYWPSVGGVERFVSDLAGRTAARGYQVEIATLNRLWHTPGGLAATEVVNGIRVHRLPFIGGALFFLAPAVFTLFSQFDLLHVHNTDFFLDFTAATQAIHRKPFVVSTHGGFFHTASYDRLKRLYFALVTRPSLKTASVVIPNSAVDERQFGQHARRCIRIDNAIDYSKFAAGTRTPVAGRLITIGRLSANKNVADVLKVFAVASRLRPGLTLTVVGDGPLRSELEAFAQTLNLAKSVKWLGAISDDKLLDELGASELFVSAARYEGFGLAAVEAMAAGLVPVVNNIDAFRDLIEPEVDGFLAEYENAEATAQTWLRALSLPIERRLEMSAQARQKARRYDWSNAIDKFEGVYQDSVKEVNY